MLRGRARGEERIGRNGVGLLRARVYGGDWYGRLIVHPRPPLLQHEETLEAILSDALMMGI